MMHRIKIRTLAALGLALTPSFADAAPITTPWIAPGGGISGSSKILGAGSSLNGKTMLDLMNQVDANQTAASSAQATANAAIPLTQKGAASGVAALDENKNVTSPLLNNVRTGGSDTGTDISAATANGIALSSAITSCQTDGATIYYGAENSASQMGDLANTANLRATGNVLPYMNVLALAAGIQNLSNAQSSVDGPVGLAAMQKVVSSIGGIGIGESWYSTFLTPHVDSSEIVWSLKSASGTVINDADVFTSTGFVPSIMMMNATTNSTSDSQMSDADVTAFQAAMTDIPATVPGVKYVWPYMAEDNTKSYKLATDDYYANTRTVLSSAGGVGIDIPAGLFQLNGESTLSGNIDTIKYANANGLRSLVLLSPYGINEGDDYDGQVLPQWRHDSHFLDHVKLVVGWLKENNALPSAWAVVSYSPTQYWDPTTKTLSATKDATHTVLVTANTMGSDTDSADQSVAYVARWVAENAPTSLTVKMPQGILNQGNPAICAATTLAGNSARKPSLGANTIGLGSLAYQDSNNAYLSYPYLGGGQLSGTLNSVKGQIAWGIGDSTSAYVYQGYDYTNHAAEFQGNVEIQGGLTTTGAVVMSGSAGLQVSGSANNIIMNQSNLLFSGSGTNGIDFQNKDGSSSFWVVGDGSGGLNLGGLLYLSSSAISPKLDISTEYNYRLTSGTNGFIFYSSDNTQNQWLNGDGKGGINLGNSLIARINGTVKIVSYTKSAILAISNPEDGEIVNDSTDHVPVIYENGSWYPITLGTALSN